MEADTHHAGVVSDAERRPVALVCALVVFVGGEGAVEASHEALVRRLRGPRLLLQDLKQTHRAARPVALEHTTTRDDTAKLYVCS